MWTYQLAQPSLFERIDRDAPRPADLAEGQVLLRCLFGGICGSDLPAFKGVHTRVPGDDGPTAAQLPGYPMHEVVGQVLASRHLDYAEGDEVVGWAPRFDGLSEQIVADGEQLVHIGDIPSGLAIAIQPLACVLYAADQLPDVSGRSVAVIGQGPIGLLFSHVLKARGAARVTGIDPVDRSDFAADFGVDESVRATSDRWSKGLADGARPSIVIEAVGHQIATLGHALGAVAPRGFVYYFGVADDEVYPVSMRDLLRKNLTLTSGITLERRRVLQDAVAYVHDHPDLLKRYVTDVYPIIDVQTAFEAACRPAPGQMKIAIRMDTNAQ